MEQNYLAGSAYLPRGVAAQLFRLYDAGQACEQTSASLEEAGARLNRICQEMPGVLTRAYRRRGRCARAACQAPHEVAVFDDADPNTVTKALSELVQDHVGAVADRWKGGTSPHVVEGVSEELRTVVKSSAGLVAVAMRGLCPQCAGIFKRWVDGEPSTLRHWLEGQVEAVAVYQGIADLPALRSETSTAELERIIGRWHRWAIPTCRGTFRSDRGYRYQVLDGYVAVQGFRYMMDRAFARRLSFEPPIPEDLKALLRRQVLPMRVVAEVEGEGESV